VLILVALTVLAIGIATLLRRHFASDEPDMGSVSERWLAEYRADSSRPSR